MLMPFTTCISISLCFQSRTTSPDSVLKCCLQAKYVAGDATLCRASHWSAVRAFLASASAASS